MTLPLQGRHFQMPEAEYRVLPITGLRGIQMPEIGLYSMNSIYRDPNIKTPVAESQSSRSKMERTEHHGMQRRIVMKSIAGYADHCSRARKAVSGVPHRPRRQSCTTQARQIAWYGVVMALK